MYSWTIELQLRLVMTMRRTNSRKRSVVEEEDEGGEEEEEKDYGGLGSYL